MPERHETDNPNNEEDLFQKEMGDVRRIEHNQAAVRQGRPAHSSPGAGDIADRDVESGEVLRFLRPGIQTSALQKLRRSQFPIEATLDLHGLTTAEANGRLQDFIRHSHLMGRQAVRVIHGKGLGSEGQQPVLKGKVNQWLREFTAVLAFCSARPEAGGTGAVEVLLRK